MAEPEAVYAELTDGLRRPLRVAELVYAAAENHPGTLPTRAEIDAERELLQKDKLGLEIGQGDFVARVLADPRAGTHLIGSMSQPTAAALARLDGFRHAGRLELGPVHVHREGNVGHVVLQNHAVLNAEDDASAAALEVAIDLVLLDDAIEVGVLRGAPATHPKYAGRRILGSGIDLTALYQGRISLVEFMLERDLGAVGKLYRGHGPGEREKPWIAALETFAIGGACQWLLVMDRVIAESGSYFSLPARDEGIVPGCANLRLPRFVGERLARQAIFSGRTFTSDSPEGRLIVDEIVTGDAMDGAIARAAAELTAAGMTAVVANRRQLRIGQEPLDSFRRYMSGYAREQARCLYSAALIGNLERNWRLARAAVTRPAAGAY